MAERGARIELGLEIFEVQSELEDRDVHVGLLRHSTGLGKACRAGDGRARCPEPAKKLPPSRLFGPMIIDRLTKDRTIQTIDLICHGSLFWSPICEVRSQR
jgi:hypothetical protein